MLLRLPGSFHVSTTPQYKQPSAGCAMMDNDQGKGLTNSRMEKEACQPQYWVYNGYGWKDAIKCSDGGSWNDALVTWRLISRNDGSCHVNTAEDGDGRDGIEERAYIFDERRCFAAMDDIGVLKPKYTAPILQSWMKGDHVDSNQV